MRRLLSAFALAALLLLGAMTPSLARGRMATHTGNCGHASTSQSHTNLRTGAHWTKTCPSKPRPQSVSPISSSGSIPPIPRNGSSAPGQPYGTVVQGGVPSGSGDGSPVNHRVPSCADSPGTLHNPGCPQTNAR